MPTLVRPAVPRSRTSLYAFAAELWRSHDMRRMVCAAIARQFFTLNEPHIVPARWGNTSITLCEPASPHRVHVLNCVEHLDSEDARDGSAPSGL